MEWVLMWTVAGLIVSVLCNAVGLAYLHAKDNHNAAGVGWILFSLLFTSVTLMIISGGYINYLTNILPIVHGR